MKLPLTRLVCFRIILDQENFISGYEIAKRTPFKHQGIYRELSKATDRGLIKFKIEPQDDKPDRKLYRVKRRDKMIEEMKMDLNLNNLNPMTISAFDVDMILSCEHLVGSGVIYKFLTRFKSELMHMLKYEKHVTKSSVNATLMLLEIEIDKRIKQAREASIQSDNIMA